MNELTDMRTPEVVGAEIRNLSSAAKYMTVWYAVEIGRRLTEAKSLVKHGEWLAWLQRETEFSQPSASRLMRIYAEYGADQGSLFGTETKYSTLNNLSVSNALRLLAVPEEERESFANEVDAEHLSTRELETAIRERDEARKALQITEARLEDTQRTLAGSDEQITDLRRRLADAQEDIQAADEQAAENERRLEERIKELEARPVEVAVQEPDPAALQKAVDAALEESRAKHTAELEKLQKKLESAEKARDKAREAAEKAGEKAAEAGKAEAEKLRTEQQTAAAEAQRYKAETEELKKKLAMSGEAVTTFKLHFTAWQRAYADMMTALDAADREAAAKLRAAVAAQLGAWGKEA